jgi:predicted Zn-dependent protease
MEATRRQKIEAMLRDAPEDVFLRYSLALEMENEGDCEGGIDILQDLARATPSYVPAYHMAGRHLAKHGRIAEARAALREGIEEARRQGESHAAGEMAEFLASLGELGD